MTATLPWYDALATEPARVATSVLLLAVATAGAAWGLRAMNRRSRSLRTQVLATGLAAVLLGTMASLKLTWLMVLDGEQLALVLTVLAVTATTAAVLVVAATATLGRDAARLEATLRRVERGERDVRTGLRRRDELGHVARAVDELTERLGQLEGEQARLEAERADMLASISHDLRTPVAALRVAVEALADGLAPDPVRYLASMQRDVEALGSLIDDLFLVVRLDRGGFEMPASSIDLTEIADEAIEALAPVAMVRDITLHLDAPGAVRVQGNATALGRVIRNLLDNALRHTPPSSTVSVTVDPEARRVRVSDEGPGFEASFVPTAFEHFTRADSSRARAGGGAGLGLAVARGVVEAHGGQIWIEPPPGGRVAFELPAA